MSTTWSCASCSTANPESLPRCAVCDATRPSAAPAAIVDVTTPLVPVVTRSNADDQTAGAPAPAPTAGTPARSSGQRKLALIVGLGVLAVLVGVGAYLLVAQNVSGDDRTRTDGRSTSRDDENGRDDEEATDRTADDADDAHDVGDDDEPTTVATATTAEVGRVATSAPPEEPTRTARLWAGVAKLRSAPSVDAAEVATFSDRDGAALTVVGSMTDGWYEVEIEGLRGYLYAGLVAPPEPGWCLALMDDRWTYSDQTTRVVYDLETGEALLPDGYRFPITEHFEAGPCG